MKDDEEIIAPYKKQMAKVAKEVFKNDMLGAAWHLQEFCEEHNLQEGSYEERLLIAKLKLDVFLTHFENLITTNNETSKGVLVDSIFSILAKIAKSKECLYYDETMDLAPPSVREADIFIRGAKSAGLRLKGLLEIAPKYKLKEYLDTFVTTLLNQKLEPGCFTETEIVEQEDNSKRTKRVGVKPKKEK